MSFQDTTNELVAVDSIAGHSSNCTTLRIDATHTRMALGSLDSLVSLWHLDDLICHSTFNME